MTHAEMIRKLAEVLRQVAVARPGAAWVHLRTGEILAALDSQEAAKLEGEAGCGKGDAKAVPGSVAGVRGDTVLSAPASPSLVLSEEETEQYREPLSRFDARTLCDSHEELRRQLATVRGAWERSGHRWKVRCDAAETKLAEARELLTAIRDYPGYYRATKNLEDDIDAFLAAQQESPTTNPPEISSKLVAPSGPSPEVCGVVPTCFVPTHKLSYCDCPQPNDMNAPDGPRCGCGMPSVHESGWCGDCAKPKSNKG
jgi:hypothetical protein